MKKISILSPVLLAACMIQPADEHFWNGVSELPIVDTLELYKEYNNNSLGKCKKPIQLEKPPRTLFSTEQDYTVVAEQNVNLQCVYSESCNTKYSASDSSVCFFDYKKYLPENSEIKTDSDFLALASKYSKASGTYGKIEKELSAFINGGMSAEKQESKRKEEVAKKKRQQDTINISDCEQAYKKALQKTKNLPDGFYIMTDSNSDYGRLKVNKNGLCSQFMDSGTPTVSDFASKGVFVSRNTLFMYTNDTDYATGEAFRHNNFVYKKTGNYRYKTVTGATRSVPAYERTTIKNYELSPLYYLKNKNLVCCQNITKGEPEIGFVDNHLCKSKRFPNGTGINYHVPCTPYQNKFMK